MPGESPTPILLALLLGGCATAGPSREQDQRIPVFRADEETPCAYELVAPIRVEASVAPYKARDYEEVRARELSRVGAEMGADAVILPDTRPWLPFSVAEAQSAIAPTPFRFEGDAVSWIPGTCRR